jgi:cyclophilin family peptidyl-prolyl cis-trans isomerase
MTAIAFEPITHRDAVPLFAARYQAYAEAKIPDLTLRGRAQCQAALAHDRAAGALELVPVCGLGQIDKTDERTRGVLSARALADAPESERRTASLPALSRHAEPAVRAAAAEGLGALTDAASAQRLAELASDSDPAVVGAAAGSIEKRKLVDTGPALRDALGRLRGPDVVEALESVASALGALKIDSAAEDLRALTHDSNAAVCLAAENALTQLGRPTRCTPSPPMDSPFAHDPVSRDPRVRVVTGHGTFHIRLHPDDAPSTVRNFLGLVRKRYFDGLTFHRVVTGFVSQGGDPRGDGSGGPGWLIPCEINPRRYETGTVGMALAGRDTGGSQFFVAHAPAPHLDGRYTVFGQVTDGIEVAFNLSEGERIVEIREE